MKSRGVALVIALVLMGSCSLPRPSLELQLTIAGTQVAASGEGTYSQTGGCSGFVADGPAPVAPLTVVRTDPPVELVFNASGEVYQIHGDVFEGNERMTRHLETFSLNGAAGRLTSASMRAGQYYILVAMEWSRGVDRGGTSRAFYVEIVPR